MTIEITKKTIYKILSYAGIGLGMFIAFIMMAEGDEDAIPFIFGLFSIGIFATYKTRQIQIGEDEVRLVKLIREKEGQVTIGDVMEELQCSSKKAIRKVKRLEKRGVLSLDMDFEGNMIYGLSPI